MPNRCNIFECRGNYNKPYVKVFPFPNDPEERERWILACANDPETLRKLSEIWACKSHFTQFKKVRGGERPTGPPSIFPGVNKSCLNQTNSQQRSTKKRHHLQGKKIKGNTMSRKTKLDHLNIFDMVSESGINIFVYFTMIMI